MSGSRGLGFISRATSMFNSPRQAILGGIIGAVTAVFALGIEATQAMLAIFIEPPIALATELGNLVRALVGGAADVVGAGALASQLGLSNLGVFSIGGFPIGIAVMGAGLYVTVRVLELSPTSDLIPFSFTDFNLPFFDPGVDEGDEEVEE
jgi:hypothetical protein